MKAITAMVVVQIATAVLNILFKLAVVDGMEPRVLVAYRLFFATLFMLPLSFIFQREKRPEFTWNLLLLSLLSGLLGAVLPSTFTVTGLALTSATFASAAAVLTPLITFVKVSKQFGGAYWNATLMNLTGSVVAVIIGLCWNCDLKEWKLGWNIRLFTIAYASIVMSGMVIAVNACPAIAPPSARLGFCGSGRPEI
ncbi:WAT1-related protein [Hirschfeldia incana]|nr:WAT1-related protein [Hirschfeldia incana]